MTVVRSDRNGFIVDFNSAIPKVVESWNDVCRRFELLRNNWFDSRLLTPIFTVHKYLKYSINKKKKNSFACNTLTLIPSL